MILTPAEMFLIACIAGLSYALYKKEKDMLRFKYNLTDMLIDLHEGRAIMTCHKNSSGGKTIRVIPKEGTNDTTN